MILLTLICRAFGLVSLAVLAAAGYLLWSWFELRDRLGALADAPETDTQPWRLYVGSALLAVAFLGRTPALWLLGRAGADRRRLARSGAERLVTSDGASLWLERRGPEGAPLLVLVHGWGMDSTTWFDQRPALEARYQTLSFDLPGLGRSSQPSDGKYSLDRFADALRQVVDQSGAHQVVLIGHSIGGMTIQQFMKRHTDLLGAKVVGIVLENTTATDPTRTTVLGRALHAMEPLLKPLMHLDVLIFPVVWAINWQSYLSGSTHLGMRVGGFGTRPTRGQLDQAALLATQNSPAVQAKGNLAMMAWEGAENLSRYGLPVLVFVGERDLITVPSAGRMIGNALPAGSVTAMAPAGHLGPMELGQEYAQAVLTFVDEVFAHGGGLDADLRASGAVSRQSQSQSQRSAGPDIRPQ